MKILQVSNLDTYSNFLVGMIGDEYLIFDEKGSFNVTAIKEYSVSEVPEDAIFVNGTLDNTIKMLLKNKYLMISPNDSTSNMLLDYVNLLMCVISNMTDDKDLKLADASKEDVINMKKKLSPYLESLSRYRSVKEAYFKERG